jgi:anti-sigma factor RsiW
MNDHLSNDLLVDFVHGELPPELDAAAHVHLAGCAACREDFELEATLTEALRAAAKAEEREMPSLVNAAVWDRIRSAQPGPMARFAAWLRPAYALPIAAVRPEDRCELLSRSARRRHVGDAALGALECPRSRNFHDDRAEFALDPPCERRRCGDGRGR